MATQELDTGPLLPDDGRAGEPLRSTLMALTRCDFISDVLAWLPLRTRLTG